MCKAKTAWATFKLLFCCVAHCSFDTKTMNESNENYKDKQTHNFFSLVVSKCNNQNIYKQFVWFCSSCETIWANGYATRRNRKFAHLHLYFVVHTAIEHFFNENLEFQRNSSDWLSALSELNFSLTYSSSIHHCYTVHSWNSFDDVAVPMIYEAMWMGETTEKKTVNNNNSALALKMPKCLDWMCWWRDFGGTSRAVSRVA